MRTHPCPKPAVHGWLYFMRVYYIATRCMEQELKEKGMTLPRFEVIAQLGVQDDCCTQESLCDKLFVTKGHISGLLDRMAKEGWVSRETDPVNRRRNRIQLTPRGRKIYQAVVPKRESCLNKMFSQLDRHEQEGLNKLLEKLLESVKSHTGGG
jgi:DNA-binding MarR family transcriptional regulator